MSVFCELTNKFSAALLKGVDGGTQDTRNYTGSRRSPTSSAGDYDYVFLGSSAPKGLQQGVWKLGFYE